MINQGPLYYHLTKSVYCTICTSTSR